VAGRRLSNISQGLSPDRPPGAANPYEIAVKGKVEG